MEIRNTFQFYLPRLPILGLLLLVGCSTDNDETDDSPNDDGEIVQENCEYDFITNEIISSCGFDYETVPYCIDCADDAGQIGTYNILIDTPFDDFISSKPERPHIMLVHGLLSNSDGPEDPWAGFFLNYMRETFCHYGFSFSNLEYRQDIPGYTGAQCTTSEGEVIRTHYRAIQDVRLALSKIHENPSAYGIDIDNLFLMGNSQGAIAILNGMMSKDEKEWLSSVPAAYQNLDVELGPWVERKPIKGIIAVAGVLYDLDFYDESFDTPLFLAHGTCDTTVPYATASFFQCDNVPEVYGSYEIACRAKQIDKSFTLYNAIGLDHNWPNDSLDELNAKIREWVIDQMVCGTPSQEIVTKSYTEFSCPVSDTELISCN